jgi:heat-inducible transcriptional repressor
MVTDFGVIRTEAIHIEKKLTAFNIKRMEAYFHWRLTGAEKPEHLDEEEAELAKKIYNEVMVRYIVGYSNFTDEDIFRTGFSKLLSYPDFYDPASLAGSLGLFENVHSMRLLLKDCVKHNKLKFWIGDDLLPYMQQSPNCAVLAIPYRINQQTAGAIGMLGPLRLPYRECFAILQAFSDSISTALTRSIYKFKINFRQPRQGTPHLYSEERHLIGQSRLMLLEDKRS